MIGIVLRELQYIRIRRVESSHFRPYNIWLKQFMHYYHYIHTHSSDKPQVSFYDPLSCSHGCSDLIIMLSADEDNSFKELNKETVVLQNCMIDSYNRYDIYMIQLCDI
jgi:hypothetical protein